MADINYFNLNMGSSERKIPWRNEEISKWVTSKGFLNKKHLIFASSGSGKTVFATLVILTTIRCFPNKKFLVYQIGETKDATKKLIRIKKFLNEKYKISFKIAHTDNIEKFKKRFDAIKKGTDTVLKPDNEFNFIFYFDDVASFISNTKNLVFFNEYISICRHFNITSIINTQLIKKIPDSIKNQVDSIIMIGNPSNSNIKNLYDFFPIFTSFFDSVPEMINFFRRIARYSIKERTAMIFRDNEAIRLYRVNMAFINMLKHDTDTDKKNNSNANDTGVNVDMGENEKKTE